jgi:hypothetical protein
VTVSFIDTVQPHKKAVKTMEDRGEMGTDDQAALEALEVRLEALLPEQYQDSYEELEPAPMRSAGLKYGTDGKVAWDEIWGSFCDLAMAGGPPHKGRLLEPGLPREIDAQEIRYEQVVREICRGATMVTGLEARPSPDPGWVRITCASEGMSGWLLRAIVMENVAVRGDGVTLDLPAAPHFRIDKEIKNVVTVIAKTCHYWVGHMAESQHQIIATMFAEMAEDSPLIEPARSIDGIRSEEADAVAARMAAAIQRDTGMQPSGHRYTGWLGVECPSVRTAIWMMRAMVVNNILARREETVLFVPIDPIGDPGGDIVARTLARVHVLAGVKGVR